MDTGKLIDSMKRVVKSELGSYDTTATVKRVEGNTAWVHIPGGVDETPVRLTMNAKEGDNVQVRVSDGKAFLAGNVSAPPTDDTTAEAAKALANRAAEDAGRAKTAADIAESYATSAQASAAQSANILKGMEQAAIAAGTTLDGIYADAAEAKATTDEINDYADTAGKTVTQILNDGETAGAAASAAQQAADTALVNLATTEDVVGVLNWITAHGTMVSQYGEVFDPDKVYFIVDPTGDYVVSGTHYSVVPSPVAEDIDSYYILNISESVQNYVATHIVVDSEGLWIIPDAGGNKVLIATGSGSTYTTAGTYIVGKINGVDTVLAQFKANGVQIGQTGESHLEMDYRSLQLKDKSNQTYLFVSDLVDSEGYITDSFTGNGVDTTFVLSAITYRVYDPNITVTINDEITSDWTRIYDSGRETYQIVFNTAPISGSVIKIKYIPAERDIKAYTLGTRESNQQIGLYSLSEGRLNIASGRYSHAEGLETQAAGDESHAEGRMTEAVKFCSHSEGYSTSASGVASHAEGRYAEAGGNCSHAQNEGTIASSGSQTALGRWNVEDNADAYAVIVGNGTADNARSNALTVDWSGNVEAAGDVTDGAGNTLSAVASALSSLIVVETKTLGTSVNVAANSNSPSYNIPSKTGYTVAAVTPIVTGGYNGHYFAAITSSNNSIPTSLYFKNTHSSAHTNSFYIRVVYIKN